MKNFFTVSNKFSVHENDKTFVPTITQEKKGILEWARWHPILRKYLTHSEEFKKNAICDFFLAYPAFGYHGWFGVCQPLMKDLTKHQIDWLDRMKSVGYKTDVFFCFEQAKRMIENYLDGIEKC
jgi:hypothetical protein